MFTGILKFRNFARKQYKNVDTYIINSASLTPSLTASLTASLNT